MTHHKRRQRHRLGIAAGAALSATLALAGCSDNAEPTPTTEGTPSESVVRSPTPTEPTVPSWEKKFTEAELDAYHAALQRWSDYEAKAEPIWAAGKATPAAEDLFKQYWEDPAWRALFGRLASYEEVEVTIKGTPEVLWSKPIKIVAEHGTGSVTIRQCIDYSPVSGIQRGEPIQQVASRQRPVQRELFLSRAKGHPWLIFEERDKPGNGGKDLPCKP